MSKADIKTLENLTWDINFEYQNYVGEVMDKIRKLKPRIIGRIVRFAPDDFNGKIFKGVISELSESSGTLDVIVEYNGKSYRIGIDEIMEIGRKASLNKEHPND